jgi:hypothetical protein
MQFADTLASAFVLAKTKEDRLIQLRCRLLTPLQPVDCRSAGNSFMAHIRWAGQAGRWVTSWSHSPLSAELANNICRFGRIVMAEEND